MFSHVQTEGESKPFFESARRVEGGVECEITPDSTCLTNKYSSAWSYRINFVDRFQDLSKEFCCLQGDDLIIT